MAKHVRVLPPPGNVGQEFAHQTRHLADLVVLAIVHFRFL